MKQKSLELGQARQGYIRDDFYIASADYVVFLVWIVS